MDFYTKQQHFTLSSAQPNCFFKSDKVLETTHSRTMASFAMPFHQLNMCAQGT